MTDHCIPAVAELAGSRMGPIAPHLPDIGAWVSRQGYGKEYGRRKLLSISEFSRWLQRRGVSLSGIRDAQVTAFLKARGRIKLEAGGAATTMAQLLAFLRQANLIAGPTPPSRHLTAIDLIAQEYQQFLLQERGLTQATAVLYVMEARRFLSGRFHGAKPNLRKLRAQDVTDFILYDEVNRRRRTAQLMASALRSFLGFLLQKQYIHVNLGGVVPRVPCRRLSELPRYLEPGQVKQLLRSCDRARKIGKRDYAVLLLAARLGLRAGELVRLTLDDVDWRAGELLIRGKRARADRLPLLKDVGTALADYLQKGRPESSSRRLFLRCTAPHGALSRHSSIYSIVRTALRRAGLHPPHGGSHLLRHSLATSMLRHGASLTQIGQVLRHQLPQTTEIYAKVHLSALRALALPWPGGEL